MKTLLLCGYRSPDANEPELGLSCDDVGQTLLDRQIEFLTESMGMSVVTVLCGSGADKQLRQATRIAQTEMAFSSNPTLLGNVREGLAVIREEACFVLPVEITPPPRAIWNFLLSEYAKLGFATNECCLQTANCHFPLLLTRSGTQILQTTEDLSSLVDTRLKYLHLAPESTPL